MTPEEQRSRWLTSRTGATSVHSPFPYHTVAFDIETSGVLAEYALQPWRFKQKKAWITTAAYAARGLDGSMVTRGKTYPNRAVLRALLEQAIRLDDYVIGWNVTFDIAWLCAVGCRDLVMQVRWLDAMRMWKHLDISSSFATADHTYALKGERGAAGVFLPESVGREDDVDYHSRDPAELAKLLAYNKDDTADTLRVAEMIWVQLTPQQRKAFLIECEALPLVAAANLEGMQVDKRAVVKVNKRMVAQEAAMVAALAEHGVTEKIVRSPKQLATLVFDTWGLKPVKNTPAGARSTDKDVMAELATDDERAAQLTKYREALNLKGKFIDGIVESMIYNEDETTRPQANIFGTYTGRFTYTSTQGKNKNERQIGFALHQMKRDSDFKNMIVAPEGHDLVEFDAAGQEFRWMAIKSLDATMLMLCADGEDAHSYMGAQISGRDYIELRTAVRDGDKAAGKVRQGGKVGNLCIAAGSMVLTDRGPVPIEAVRLTDRVWDGIEFVNHDGVTCSGVRPVMSYMGVSATHAHEVMVNDEWQQIQDAARHGRRIQSAMGQGWAGRGRAAVRIMGGLVRRAGAEVGRTLRGSAVRLRDRAAGGRQLSGGRALGAVQGLCCAAAASSGGQAHRGHLRRQAASEASQRHAAAMLEPEGGVVSQLWRARDRVQVRFDQGMRGVYQAAVAPRDVSEAGHRPAGERWSLRAWKLALGYAQGEPCQSETALVYDIVNCGPRTRFSANGLIVHNSLQYRTSARTFRVRARSDHNLVISAAESDRICKTYLRSYPGVPQYWTRQIQLGRKLGYAETLAGRRVQVKGNWAGQMQWPMESTMINYPIQGTGGDQKYLAMSVLRTHMNDYDARFAWDLHDGIYFYVPKDKSLKFAHDMRAVLGALPYDKAWGFKSPIPLPWDAKIGPAWGSLKEIK